MTSPGRGPTRYPSFAAIQGSTVHMRLGSDGAGAKPKYSSVTMEGEPFGLPGHQAAIFRCRNGRTIELNEYAYSAWTRHAR